MEARGDGNTASVERSAAVAGAAARTLGNDSGDDACWVASAACTAAAAAVANLLHDQPAFDSFFADAREAPGRTAAAQALLLRWLAYRGDRGTALVVVTHQVNITALCGVYPASGEGVVLRRTPASSGASAVDTGTAAGRPSPQLLVVGRVLP